jgi:actin-like protein 6A
MVDIGAGGCRVTPIVEGLVLEQSQRRNGRGGEWLNHVTWKALLEEKIVPKPHYQLRSTKKSFMAKSSLYHQWAIQELILEFRTGPHVKVDSWCQDLRVPFTPPPMDDSDESSSGAPESPGPSQPTSYTLPDGTEVDLSTPTGRDFCRIPELLFSDDVPYTSAPPSSNLKTLSDQPLHKLIQQSLLAVGDVDVRKDLAGCVCLVGNGSQNLEARLSAELTSLLPTMAKPKVTASRTTVERACSAWIGASVLTSLGSFQQLWLSKTEYEEYGSSMATQRFP